MLEPDISPVHIEEEIALLFPDDLPRTSVWWCLLDAIVDEVTSPDKLELVCNGPWVSLSKHTHSQQEPSSRASFPPPPS